MSQEPQMSSVIATQINKKRKQKPNKSEKDALKVITIDGPAGSGKSTVASLVAKFLCWTYVTTGAIYRTLGWILKEEGVELSDVEGVKKCVQILVDKYRQDPKTGSVYLQDLDISERIRTPEASERASIIAKDAFIREKLLPVQRKVVISCDGAVVDGRDMGTIVFPESPLKIFLTAAPEERARRRAQEMRQKGLEVDMDALVKEIYERDERDASRSVAPMKPAIDAVYLDCTTQTADEIAQLILKHALDRGLVQFDGSPM